MGALRAIWRAIGNLVLPPGWTHDAWPKPSPYPPWVNMTLREAYAPQINDQIYAASPLFWYASREP